MFRDPRLSPQTFVYNLTDRPLSYLKLTGVPPSQWLLLPKVLRKQATKRSKYNR